ncbi:MAG TPA: disulfide bond formation protein B [Candidatus Levybacteria bacterium]|nr:disulfide bond formation protein B [Candidatus Levybacteria bacterium]
MAKQTSTNPLFSFLAKNYLSFGFLITSTAVVGSLFISEVMMLPPCDLCWYQRAFMYPQAIIFGVAMWKNDRSIVRYVLPISVVGLLIGIYHNLLQLNPDVLPCTNNSSVSCATKQIELLGLDVIPLMSVASYALLIILTLIARRVKA